GRLRPCHDRLRQPGFAGLPRGGMPSSAEPSGLGSAREEHLAATEREVPTDGGHLIKRPRLTRMLDESNARIILLVAPAGYGKTTLAREWLEGKPHVWYRASSADADVAALAVGLASAAAEFVPGADRRVRQRVKAACDPEEEASVLAELVADDLGRLPG